MKKAFSLIELSIVILIIGILIAGVTQGSRLVGAMRLASGRALTQSSPVPSIKGLTAWFETTSEASIADAQAEDGTQVTVWNDINPSSSPKYNTTGGPGAVYKTNCVNGLPCLRFNGTIATYFTYDGTFLAGTDYTIFAVEQRRIGGGAINYFMGGTAGSANNTNLQLGYLDDTRLIFAQWGNDYTTPTTAYSSPAPKVLTFRYSSTGGKAIYVNGGSPATLTVYGSAAPNTGLTSYAGAMIGRYFQNLTTYLYYTGDLCEIIIFTRALNTEERTSIQNYLGKKWGVKIS